ncbi:MAG: hypothetical protein KatS3mg129_1142 [Leptospiraceae bacterium]|nr:MAG: hypothetical protein KatS3mg129_1142 [Leptospiraceae bacterium]
MEVLIREFRYSLSVIKFILTSIKKYKDVDIKEKLNELYSSNKITEEEMESTNKLLENINFELLSKYIKKNEYEDLELTEKGNNLYNILGSANLDEPAIYKNIHNFVNDKNDKNKKLIEKKVLTFFQLTECIIYNYIFYKFA